jgi:hypothetical protein
MRRDDRCQAHHPLETTLGRSGQTAPQGSLSLRTCLRAQLAVTSLVNANSFSSRPYRVIRSASRYRPERPHFDAQHVELADQVAEDDRAVVA